jgi:hypothetical protein
MRGQWPSSDLGGSEPLARASTSVSEKGTMVVPEMITLHLSAGAGVGSSQKGILRVIASGAALCGGYCVTDRARMPSRPLTW